MEDNDYAFFYQTFIPTGLRIMRCPFYLPKVHPYGIFEDALHLPQSGFLILNNEFQIVRQRNLVVRFPATGFISVTLPRLSVAITASPML
jgi:hypothetical protein